MKKICMFFALLFCAISFSGCSLHYDEEDASIIAYLRINDLLEDKIKENCKKEIKDLDLIVNCLKKSGLIGFYLSGYPYVYNEEYVETFYKNYKNYEIGNGIDMELLHAAISIELWNYIVMVYEEDIYPSKAQNTKEGRYYTIDELRSKYPDYKDVELEGFSPMPLISTVMQEGLFEPSFYAQGGINLKTLYSIYMKNELNE